MKKIMRLVLVWAMLAMVPVLAVATESERACERLANTGNSGGLISTIYDLARCLGGYVTMVIT